MARKNRVEFKPDSTGASLLRRLYLTPKQRKSLLKWCLYSIVCLVLSVLQDVIFSRVSIFGATTDLLPCALMLICMIQGAETGGVFTLICAVLYFFSGSAPGVYVILLLPLLGMVAAIFRRSFLRSGFSSAMLCCGAATVLYELAVFVMGILLGQTLFSRLHIFIAAALIALATLPVIYPLIRAIGKIGGESWKE